MSYHKANNLANHLFADRTHCSHLQNVKNSELERKKKTLTRWKAQFLKKASSPSYI